MFYLPNIFNSGFVFSNENKDLPILKMLFHIYIWGLRPHQNFYYLPFLYLLFYCLLFHYFIGYNDRKYAQSLINIQTNKKHTHTHLCFLKKWHSFSFFGCSGHLIEYLYKSKNSSDSLLLWNKGKKTVVLYCPCAFQICLSLSWVVALQHC